MSGSKSPRLSGPASRRSPELLPAAAAILLLVAAVAQFALPSEAELPVVAHAHAAAQTAEAARPAMHVYASVMAHPIFAPDRQPPPAEAEESGNLSGVEVLGTAIAGKNNAAALVRDSDGEFMRVKVGGEIEGWKLVAITPKELTFDRNGERQTMVVDVAKLHAQAPKGADGKTLATGTAAQSAASGDDNEDDDSGDDSEDDE